MKFIRSISAVVLTLLAANLMPLAASPKPPEKPAEIKLDVDPATVQAGGTIAVRIALEPIKGVKINRYPHIKLSVAERPGVVSAGSASVGSNPPEPDKMAGNYFETVDPVELILHVHEDATAGSHDVVGKLTYFYCMPESGFCAPHRVAVTIPVEID